MLSWVIDIHVDVNQNSVVCTVNTAYVSMASIFASWTTFKSVQCNFPKMEGTNEAVFAMQGTSLL